MTPEQLKYYLSLYPDKPVDTFGKLGEAVKDTFDPAGPPHWTDKEVQEQYEKAAEIIRERGNTGK